MQQIKNIILFVTIIMFCQTADYISAQELNDKKYDIFSDTLIIINGKTIDSERILMSRQEILKADTFQINQKGLKIVSFTMTALTLGHSIELTNDKPIISQAMHNEILNKQSNFKFIYIKNIILQTKDGRKVYPSMQTVKVIFSN